MACYDKNSLLRALPKMDRLLADAEIKQYLDELPRATVVDILRGTLEEHRKQILASAADTQMQDKKMPDKDAAFEQLKHAVLDRLTVLSVNRLKRVINATGVILHTNLGRAPLSKTVLEQVTAVSSGYCNLEYDVFEGRRDNRNTHVERLLTALTGAEAALVVNNNAAAVYLALNTLCINKEVIVSRGEIVEIGDSFRIMEVVENSGCTVREVGTVNHTRITDYEKYIGGNTGALLKVHRSNFKLLGFASETPTAELASLRDRQALNGLIVMEDMGSGLLKALTGSTFENERTAADAIQDGADIITFSGDKLLGGPQAGIIAGKRKYVEPMKKNPLYRCLRIDKLCLAALEAVLFCYAQEDYSQLPVLRMLSEPLPSVRQRAEFLCGLLKDSPNLQADVGPHQATPGGGARPGEALDSFAVFIVMKHCHAEAVAKHLRIQPVPVIAMVKNDSVVLDMRTVEDNDVPYIAKTLTAIAACPQP